MATWLNQLRSSGNQIKQRLEGIGPIELVIRAIKGLSEDDGTHFAAGVAYYAFLSIFPLLLGLIALMSLIIDEQQVRQAVSGFVQSNLPGSSGFLQDTINTIYNSQGQLGIIAIAGLFWTASAVFGAISRSVNRAWDITEDRPFYIAKAIHLLMGLGVGILVALSAAVTPGRQIVAALELEAVQLPNYMENIIFRVFATLLTLAIAFVIFTLIYKFIPNTPTRWKDVWLGGLIAAVLFEIGKTAFIIYLNNFSSYSEVYGTLASVVILVVWLYYSALILILGAEFASEYARMKQGIPQGVPVTEAAPQASANGREREPVRR